MTMDAERVENPYAYTQNREVSWLRFNRRVLEEAGDESVPLLFFMVRVGNLFDLSLVSPGEIDNKTGLTPLGQLGEIYSVVPGLIEIKNRLYADVAALLRQKGICDLAMEELSPEERKYVSTYYKAKILPVLSPQIVDSRQTRRCMWRPWCAAGRDRRLWASCLFRRDCRLLSPCRRRRGGISAWKPS